MCLAERDDRDQTAEDQEEIPDLNTTQQVSHLEKRNNTMCRSDGLELIRSLNDKQLAVFFQIHQWCLDKITGKNPDPLHLFITGGAGTGKSHLIRAIEYESVRLLSTMCHQPDNICVLLTAPTGIAAHNLHAATIHNTLSIGKDVRLPYTPLGEEKLNSLRAKYCDLQILIIDEISMVDHNLLAYVHGRLRQIKQCGNFSPFGNVSIIAVGDFFQLPPVRGKPLYVEDVSVNLWSSLFKVVELQEIIRQKDQVFAQLLNRIRTHKKGSPMLKSDIDLLKACETCEDSKALHIFATNAQVDEYNITQLQKTCPDYVQISAQDYMINKKTGKLQMIGGHHSKTYGACLSDTLLGLNARVMLCKNIDVEDGLVNGVCGTVTQIITCENKAFPQKVFVKFDDDNIGTYKRRQLGIISPHLRDSTPIEAQEEKVTKKGGMRRQFPLKLAWACTVHKVQGITVDNAVVSLKGIFAPGQAYVALSRVKTLSGLIIQDMEEKRIYCKDGVQNIINNMTPYLTDKIAQQALNPATFSIFLMNVQSLTHHLPDLTKCVQHLNYNCIAVTETWLCPNTSLETVNIPGFKFHSCPRSSSYSGNVTSLLALQSQQHGGVGIYTADADKYEIVKTPPFNLECLVYSSTTYDMSLIIIYRPPSYPISLFKQHLDSLLNWLHSTNSTIVVMGDFNEDIFKSSSICKHLLNKGYVQIVEQPTTEKGTLIDHVYVKTTYYKAKAIVVPTYFSDHEGILCSLSYDSCQD